MGDHVSVTDDVKTTSVIKEDAGGRSVSTQSSRIAAAQRRQNDDADDKYRVRTFHDVRLAGLPVASAEDRIEIPPDLLLSPSAIQCQISTANNE
jgi:hypothetical protein